MNQNPVYKYEEEVEIDLKELFYVLLRKWHLIFLTTLLTALLAMGYARFFIPKSYQSQTSIYINNRQSENVTYNDLQTSVMMTTDYAVLIKSRTVLENVIQRLDLNISYQTLYQMISVNIPEDTRIVEIRVRTGDPYLSYDIAETVREISSKSIAEVMGVDAITIVERANLPKSKCAPDIGKYILLGGMLGAVASIAVITVLFLMDDTLHTEEDVEKYLGLNVIGQIPMNQNMKDAEKRSLWRKTYGVKRTRKKV